MGCVVALDDRGFLSSSYRSRLFDGDAARAREHCSLNRGDGRILFLGHQDTALSDADFPSEFLYIPGGKAPGSNKVPQLHHTP